MKNSPKAVMRLVPSKVNLLPLRLQGMFDLVLVSTYLEYLKYAVHEGAFCPFFVRWGSTKSVLGLTQ